VGGWWLYQSPLLRIQEVTVNGTRLLDPEELAAIAALHDSSTLFPNTGGARRRLESVPMVKSVTFERAWPQGMRIIVQERRPWGFWEAGGRRYVIDEEGFVLERVLPDEGAPLIHHLDARDSLEVGDRVDPDAVALTRRLVETAPQALGLAVATVDYSNQSGLTAVFSAGGGQTAARPGGFASGEGEEGGLRVTFGDGRDFDYKMAALRALLERARQQGVEVRSVDLRFGERIAFQ
jgi:cell division protein FtsQ